MGAASNGQNTKEKIVAGCVLAIALAVGLGYIEGAVVVYLREIFHPNGFVFPLEPFGVTGEARRLLLTEVGRETATIVVILSACLVAGRNRRQRLAYFLMIFAVWDIFYYVWLRALIGWPATVLDWDVLFLIPAVWAGPVLAPVLVSIAMFVFAGVILYRDYIDKPIRAGVWDWAGFTLAGVIIIVSFCIAGRYIQSPEYATYFSWLLFGAGLLGGIGVFGKCALKKTPTTGVGAKRAE
jgi:hypothetical protein